MKNIFLPAAITGKYFNRHSKRNIVQFVAKLFDALSMAGPEAGRPTNLRVYFQTARHSVVGNSSPCV
jgi:hypothetical protein